MTAPAWRADLPSFSERFLAEYEILDVLGEGGMGRVYLARQSKLDREVAVKVLKSLAEGEAQRFEREARVLAGMAHARILRVFDHGTDAGVSYLVTERLSAETLERRIRREPLTLREALRVCARVADALGYAHAEGVVHRDVKPDNVFLLEELEIKLGDFGLARDVLGESLTAQGTIMGTPEYMAPEQVAAKAVGPAADQYSLGTMLFKLITQTHAFAAESPLATAMQRLRVPPPSARELCPTLPEGVDRLLLRAMSVSPADRYPMIDEMRRELEHLADEIGLEGERVFRPVVRSARSRVLAPEADAAASAPATPALSHVPTAEIPVPGATWPWLLLGILIAIGIAFPLFAPLRKDKATGKSVAASDGFASKSSSARVNLLGAIGKLDPLARIEELRQTELEALKRKGPDKVETLKSVWTPKFENAIKESGLAQAWSEWQSVANDALRHATLSERLQIRAAIEDLAYLCYGLANCEVLRQRFDLPHSLVPDPARAEAPDQTDIAPDRMSHGRGFRLRRYIAGGRIDYDVGEHAREDLKITPVESTDDNFTVSAPTHGTGNEAVSILDGVMRVEEGKKGPEQVEYTHPAPFELVDPSKLESVALVAFVSAFKPLQRFEVYASSSLEGTYRRIATFRKSAPAVERIWLRVAPEVLPAAKIWLRVRFTALPCRPNNDDDAQLHQLSIHWRAKSD